ncbi:MAG: glycosyl hydrolase family 28 protein [Paludibaculum sp.]
MSNCAVECQDDACALFGSCQFITVTNCTFSTRWSVFRFGGGSAENITVSNCLIHDTYGCPIKLRGGEGPRLENISFSNLVMKNVTGPISICLGPRNRRPGTPPSEQLPTEGIVRNISFRGIRATVTVPVPFPDVPFVSNYNPGEIKSCIGFSGVGGYLENISFDDVHITYPGGGTAEEGAVGMFRKWSANTTRPASCPLMRCMPAM